MIDQLQNKITKFKTGFTTRCSDPSYPKVLYNSMYPSLRYAMDKFRDEKEENRKKTQFKTISVHLKELITVIDKIYYGIFRIK